MLAVVLATGSGMAMADRDVGCGIGSQYGQASQALFLSCLQVQQRYSLTSG